MFDFASKIASGIKGLFIALAITLGIIQATPPRIIPPTPTAKPNSFIFQPRLVTDFLKATSTGGLTTFNGFVKCFSVGDTENLEKNGVGIYPGVDPSCKIPSSVIEAGNLYLKNLLGNEYFEKYIRYDQKNSNALDEGGVSIWVLPFYDNRVTLLNKEQPFGFSLKINELSMEVRPSVKIPDCRHNPVLCRTNVSEKQALEMARLNKFDSDSNKIFRYSVSYARYTGVGWAWYLTKSDPAKKMCPDSTSKSETIEINISTGQISPIIIGAGDCTPWRGDI